MLPCPRDQNQLDDLTLMGIKYDEDIDLEENTMVEAALPSGWGLFKESSRGDIEHILVCDDRHRVVASILWVSEGAYDNKCSINAKVPVKRRLVAEGGEIQLIDGWFECPSPVDTYKKILARYESQLSYYSGTGDSGQEELDRYYEKEVFPAWEEARKSVPELPRPAELMVPGGTALEGAIKAVAIAPTHGWISSSAIKVVPITPGEM